MSHARDLQPGDIQPEPNVGGPYEHAFAVPEGEINLDTLIGEAHGPLVQRGNMIYCMTDGHQHAASIPNGKQLGMKDGKYVLTDVVVRDKSGKIRKNARPF